MTNSSFRVCWPDTQALPELGREADADPGRPHLTPQPREVGPFSPPVSAAWKGAEPTPPRHTGPCPIHRSHDGYSLRSGTHMGRIISQGHQQGEECMGRWSEMILLAWHRREVAVCSPRTLHFAFSVWQEVSMHWRAGMLLALWVLARTHPRVL